MSPSTRPRNSIGRAKLLINAEGAAKEKGAKDKNTAHYAYLATQMARISQQRAQEQVATARVKAGETERQKILLAARENEADQAKASAGSIRRRRRVAAARRSQLENMQASQTPRGIVLTLDDVLFDTGKASSSRAPNARSSRSPSFLKENPDRRVQVEGFTDSQGADDYNLELSQSRADSVAMAIIQRGVDAQRVRALGYGEGYPVASNDSAGSRQLNRRVEIIVSNDKSEFRAARPGHREGRILSGGFWRGTGGRDSACHARAR